MEGASTKRPFLGASYAYEDLTASKDVANVDDPNPYNVLLAACESDPTKIQSRYMKNRETRAEQQREKFLSPSFPGFNIDNILLSVTNEENGVTNCGFEDTRHNLSIWGRPNQPVKNLVGEIQERLREILPDLWCMPLDRLHMTCMEITHSQTADRIKALEGPILRESNLASEAVNIPSVDYENIGRLYRLVRPMVACDATGIALTYVPAAGEPSSKLRKAQTEWLSTSNDDSGITYHHLRAILWDKISNTSLQNRVVDERSAARTSEHANRGILVNARYVVPTAHITIGRYISMKSITVDNTEDGPIDHAKVAQLMHKIDEINAWLREEMWPPSASTSQFAESYRSKHNSSHQSSNADERGKEDSDEREEFRWAQKGGEWIVGEEVGLDLRSGVSWYGGGYTCIQADAFSI